MDTVESYLSNLKAHGRREATITSYRSILAAVSKILAQTGRTLDPQDASTDAYISIRCAPGLTETSRRTYCDVYNRYIRAVTGRNLAEDANLLWGPMTAQTARWITDEQYRVLWDHADARGRVVLALGAWIGMRREEIAIVKWSDISGGRILVHGKGHGPDGKVVSMLIPPAVHKALEVWRLQCPAESEVIIASTQPKNGDWSMSPEGIAAIVKRLGACCGIDVTTHSLRRLYACDLDAREVPPTQIAQLMRHECIETTYRRYLRPNRAKLDEIAAGCGAGY